MSVLKKTKVCLISECSYPFHYGGVGNCIEQIIDNFPELEFNLVYIGGSPSENKIKKYLDHKNVNTFSELYLFEKMTFKQLNGEVFNLIFQFVKNIYLENETHFNSLLQQKPKTIINFKNRSHRKINLAFYQELVDLVQKSDTQIPFADFYNSFKSMCFATYKLVTFPIPDADIYHAFSNGYGALLGALQSHRKKGQFVLSEHGIYQDEREIEWSIGEKKSSLKIHNFWKRYFVAINNFSYHQSSTITTLNNSNYNRQIQLGAKKEKIKIIPNAIQDKNFPVTDQYYNKEVITLGWVGRIHPLKNPLSFIRILHKLKSLNVKFKAIIIGPIDDSEYYDECVSMVRSLNISALVTFSGFKKRSEIYNSINILVSTSVSEGMPLVFLEAMASGICIASYDVGGCKELLKNYNNEMVGICLPFEAEDKMAIKLKDLIERGDLRKKYVRLGKEWSMNGNFSLKKLISNYTQVYTN